MLFTLTDEAAHPDAGDIIAVTLVGESLRANAHIRVNPVVGLQLDDHLDDPTGVQMRVETAVPFRIYRLLLLDQRNALICNLFPMISASDSQRCDLRKKSVKMFPVHRTIPFISTASLTLIATNGSKFFSKGASLANLPHSH